MGNVTCNNDKPIVYWPLQQTSTIRLSILQELDNLILQITHEVNTTTIPIWQKKRSQEGKTMLFTVMQLVNDCARLKFIRFQSLHNASSKRILYFCLTQIKCPQRLFLSPPFLFNNLCQEGCWILNKSIGHDISKGN